MGALIMYDEMVPVPDPQGRGIENPTRQLEVFTMAEDIFIRMGTVDGLEEPGWITGQLSVTEAHKLARALDDALGRIGQV